MVSGGRRVETVMATLAGVETVTRCSEFWNFQTTVRNFQFCLDTARIFHDRDLSLAR